jgi:hypothetical protein
MTNTENTSNQFFSSRSAYKDQIKDFQLNPVSWPYSRNSSLIKPKPLNNYTYISNISLTKNSTLLRINSSFCSLKSKEDELFGNLFQLSHLKNKRPFSYDFPMETIFKDNAITKQYQLKEENNEKLKRGKAFNLDPSKILFNYAESENENENENEDSENISFFGQGKIEPKKENIQPNYNNIGAKFFINHNYGYKCSCTKTNCNRNYCECYNSGNYCIDCNCKNCENKPPVYAYTNKHPDDINSKNKKNKEICTCTKSGCNKNYCECFKSGNKCSSLCRCIGCENTENKITNNYKCCPANNICIKKNKIYDLKNEIKLYKRMEVNIKSNLNKGENCKIINAKRRREETKSKDEANVSKGKSKRKKNSEEINLFNDSLFDNNGKVILKNMNLLHL